MKFGWMPTHARTGFCAAGFCLAVLAAAGAVSSSQVRAVVFTPWSDARSVVESLPKQLPRALEADSAAARHERWNEWIRGEDARIRARLLRGEEDTLVNLLLFGTSFTRQPRITPQMVENMAGQNKAGTGGAQRELAVVLKARIDDLVAGIEQPDGNERLVASRRLLEREGYRFGHPGARRRVAEFLLENTRRVMHEQSSYAQALEAARALGNPEGELQTRSTLLRSRGLSVDTSLFPNLAIERALGQLERRGLLKKGSVRRVAIVGPGLDFTDKQSGYDFYPLQSIQPFALIESLDRLGLGKANEVEVTTLDISSQVNAHLERARRRARSGVGYRIELPLDPAVDWKAETLDYWRHFGDRIAVVVRPVRVPAALAGLDVRAVRVRAAVAARVRPVDLDIVAQRLTLAPGERFDLVVATNVLIYYDVFEQSLAMTNLAAMLRPGGFLLSNNELRELPAIPLHLAGETTTVYSSRPNDSDRVVCYERTAERERHAN